VQRTNYDSLYQIGDSVLSGLLIEQAKARFHNDSLTSKVDRQIYQLSQKQIQEQRDRIIYKDTVITRIRFQEIVKTDTIRRKVIVIDTIVDTVKVSYFEWRRINKKK
jgi:hypothetical protein